MSWNGAILTDSGAIRSSAIGTFAASTRRAFSSVLTLTEAKICSLLKRSSTFSRLWGRIFRWFLMTARPIRRVTWMRRHPWSFRCAGRENAGSIGAVMRTGAGLFLASYRGACIRI
jgi:hypothetical protein